jgi:hypothetical protein
VNGPLVDGEEVGRYLAVSLGIFSVIRLVRNGQLLISGSEYCLPEKECVATSDDNPCTTFQNIPFPTSEFCSINATAATVNGASGKRCCGNS